MNKLLLTLFATSIATSSMTYAKDKNTTSEERAAFKEAKEICHDANPDDRAAMAECMQALGYEKPSRDGGKKDRHKGKHHENSELRTAMKECRDTADGDREVFKTCLIDKGFDKPERKKHKHHNDDDDDENTKIY